MMSKSEAPTTQDAFLGGRLQLHQPRQGFRAGVGAVLLAAAVPARSGMRVLELGCGVGTAALCLATRVSGMGVDAVELNPEYADLARQNACENGLAMTVFTADLASLPNQVRAQQYDHVFANPPYFRRVAGSAAPDAGREAARGEATPLQTWLDVAARRLAPKGMCTFIQDVTRLPDLLSAADQAGLVNMELQPLSPRVGRQATRVLLRARRQGGRGLRLHAPIHLHEGAAHEADQPDYTDTIEAVLREGAALRFASD